MSDPREVIAAYLERQHLSDQPYHHADRIESLLEQAGWLLEKKVNLTDCQGEGDECYVHGSACDVGAVPPNSLVQAAAEALHDRRCICGRFDRHNEVDQRIYRGDAEAALAALARELGEGTNG